MAASHCLAVGLGVATAAVVSSVTLLPHQLIPAGWIVVVASASASLVRPSGSHPQGPIDLSLF